MTDYIDRDGEMLTEDEAKERYRDFLDEVYNSVTIGEVTFAASTILEECDPTAFRVYFSDWVSEYPDLDDYTPGHEWEEDPYAPDADGENDNDSGWWDQD